MNTYVEIAVCWAALDVLIVVAWHLAHILSRASRTGPAMTRAAMTRAASTQRALTQRALTRPVVSPATLTRPVPARAMSRPTLVRAG